MQLLVLTAIGLALLWFVLDTIRLASRFKLLRDRVDTICVPRDFAMEPDVPALGPLSLFAGKAGLTFSGYMGRLYVLAGVAAIGAMVVLGGWVAGIVVAPALIAAYWVMARWHRTRQSREFTYRLPGFLERVRRLILIGNTFPQAFVGAVADADPVVKRHVDPVVRRIRYGAPFPESIDYLAQQNDIVELHMLAAYVKTNAKFGGRVAQTLESLIAQLSSKHRLEREIRAATSETRTSAMILLGLTAMMIIGMSVFNPWYVQYFLETDHGKYVLLGILLWPCIGALVMKRILSVDF